MRGWITGRDGDSMDGRKMARPIERIRRGHQGIETHRNLSFPSLLRKGIHPFLWAFIFDILPYWWILFVSLSRNLFLLRVPPNLTGFIFQAYIVFNKFYFTHLLVVHAACALFLKCLSARQVVKVNACENPGPFIIYQITIHLDSIRTCITNSVACLVSSIYSNLASIPAYHTNIAWNQ